MTLHTIINCLHLNNIKIYHMLHTSQDASSNTKIRNNQLKLKYYSKCKENIKNELIDQISNSPIVPLHGYLHENYALIHGISYSNRLYGYINLGLDFPNSECKYLHSWKKTDHRYMVGLEQNSKFK